MILELHAIIVLLLLSLLIVVQFYFNNSTILKLLVVTIFVLASSAFFFSLESYKGWYASGDIDKGYLIWTQIYEPTDKNEGAIYLWVVHSQPPKTWQKLLSYTPKNKFSPRSYYLPYTDDLAQASADAMNKIQEGYVVEVEVIDGKAVTPSEGKDKNAGEGKDGDTDAESDYESPFRFLVPSDIYKKGN